MARDAESEKPDTPQIRGSIVGSARTWIAQTYGRDLLERALSSLDPAERARVEGTVLPLEWFPLEIWDRFTLAVAREVLAKTGEDERTFERRIVMESGQTALTRVYRFVFSLLDSTTVLARAIPILRRIYSHGVIELVQNERGHCVLRYSEVPDSMVRVLRRTLPSACEGVLDLAGQKVVSYKVRDERSGSQWTVTYDGQYTAK